jgi:transcriptional regulator with GAF, ATPase, and Fis domain
LDDTFSKTLPRPDVSPTSEARRVSYLFLVLRCDPPLGAASRHCLDGLDEVRFLRSREPAVIRSRVDGRQCLELRLPDRLLSSTHARLTRALDRWTLVDEGSTNGSLINGAPVARALVADGDLIELGHTFFLYRENLPDVGGQSPDFVPPATETPGLVTLSPALSLQLEQLRRLAPSSLSILVRGESGCGKELIARAIHQLSARKGPFVAVNCGALPGTLVESELFGYRKGAFSGADADRPGLIRSADGGTLFLDEIGDLPLPAQAALLPVGATRSVAVDVRFVAATHRDLDAMVAAQQFRADLLARLDGWTLRLPPLRERREDLGLLADALLARSAADGRGPVALGWEAARALLRHDWPLNVRELDQSLTAAAILSGGTIELAHLPGAIRRGKPVDAGAPEAPPPQSADEPLSPADQQRREELIAQLTTHRGNVAAVARAMAKAPIQIRRWLVRYGLDLDRFRG